MTAPIDNRDCNLLESAADWFETRANGYYFAAHKSLMLEHAKDLRRIREKLLLVAVYNPVTIAEVFEVFEGKKP